MSLLLLGPTPLYAQTNIENPNLALDTSLYNDIASNNAQEDHDHPHEEENVEALGVVDDENTEKEASEFEHSTVEEDDPFFILIPKCDVQLVFTDCKEEVKSFIKQDFRFFQYILGYAAIRENNPDLCDALPDDNSTTCKNVAEDALTMQKNLAKGSCGEFPPPFRSICLNLNKCFNLYGWKKDLCDGFSQGDIELIRKAQTSEEYCQLTEDCQWNEADNVKGLSAYYGFKFQKYGKGMENCLKYSSTLEGPHAYLCEILFNVSPIDEVLDKIADDFAYYMLSESRNSLFLCKHIKNINLQNACYSEEREEYLKNNF